MPKGTRPALLIPLSFVLAWIFDHFFWGRDIGLSYPVFIALILMIGFWMANQAGFKPARASLWLLLPIALLSLASVFRAEPLTLLTSRLMGLVLLAVFALSFRGGQWVQYGFADYIAKLFLLVPEGLGLLGQNRPAPEKKSNSRFSLRSLAPMVRGLLFVLPILLFLSVLLSSADPYFADLMGSLFFDLQNVPEYAVRGLILLGVAFVLAGVYLFAFTKSYRQELLGSKKPLVSPLLGFGEVATMLISINLLFAAFVFVQFRYFFGGVANVVNGPNGFTYAEYARRGFFELVVVAVVALFLFIALSSISRRQPGKQQAWFSGLGVALFVLVAVILVSAFERLLLLEEAYGFTRLRTYPHIFMIWLGILLLAVVILETLRRHRAFALAVLLAVLGFTFTLPLLNVDAFIVNINVRKAQSGAELDHDYLSSLSDDAVPPLVSAFKSASASGDAELSTQIAVALACHFVNNSQDTSLPWQSWTWSNQIALQEWEQVQTAVAFPVTKLLLDSVLVDGVKFTCESSFFLD